MSANGSDGSALALTDRGSRKHSSNLGIYRKARSVVTYTNLVKLIVASALDRNGEQLFPRKWNNEFMDVPLIQKQFQPTFTQTEMEKIVAMATGKARALYALLAGSGFRVGEALGLEIKHLSPDCRTLTIEQSCRHGKMLTPKTHAGYRQVDLCTDLAILLKAYVAGRHRGWVVANRRGRPLSQTNLVRRSLHPILEEIGATKTGFHAMRRFSTTWLRKQRTPEDLIRFWLGHAKPTVTEGYSKLDEDVAYRLEVAETVGLGFTVPTTVEPMRPMRPRNQRTNRTEVAA